MVLHANNSPLHCHYLANRFPAHNPAHIQPRAKEPYTETQPDATCLLYSALLLLLGAAAARTLRSLDSLLIALRGPAL